MGRTIAIGDIHGCDAALAAIVAAVAPTADDTLVVLGDFVDRGPNTRGVIDQLLALSQRCRLETLLGNHEEMLLLARDDELELRAWLQFGGRETLASYQASEPTGLPDEHLQFIAHARQFFETKTHLFLHASYDAHKHPSEFSPHVLRWESLWERIPPPHNSGKHVIVGHTALQEGEVFHLGYLTCIDTYCHGGGWLTALEPTTGQVWQADRHGTLREEPPQLDVADQPPGAT
ncbi:MAG: metallophosphoesterase [Pirellulales bacterium]